MPDPNYSKLSKVLSELDLPARPEQFTDSKIFQDWRRAAGDNIAQNTARLSIDNGVISATVTSPTWAHALLNSQTTILRQLRDLGYQDLRQMSIQVSLPASKSIAPIPHQAADTPKAKSGSRVVTPRLQKLFTEIAENAVNPKTRETFARLSKLNARDQ